MLFFDFSKNLTDNWVLPLSLELFEKILTISTTKVSLIKSLFAMSVSLPGVQDDVQVMLHHTFKLEEQSFKFPP